MSFSYHDTRTPFQVRVANVGDEDLCLQPRTRIGVLHVMGSLETDVGFHKVAVNEEILVLEEAGRCPQESTAGTPCPIDPSGLDLSMELHIGGFDAAFSTDSIQMTANVLANDS